MDNYSFVDRPSNQRIQLMNDVSEEDAIITELFLDFQWTYRNMQKVYDDVLDKNNLSESRFIILMFLKRAQNQELLPSVIAEKLGATRATVSKLLKAMELKGWITKKTSTVDKRAIPVQLTEAGMNILEDFLPINFQTVHQLFDQLTLEEMQQFSYLLKKIKQGTANATQEMEQ
ncbi:Organic hydroperoxide resistance transcriptional regulator [Listeria ivanovii subsp. londoniensis]|uniref:MarR family transcriptional regulator n=2 Tax=Listeria ivanovii TaxID=1638 RepID=A0ABS1G6B0_LISIV|nr:MarR family transcriptional regulator [Listeria ivanovii]EFR96644.1 transcriptional regulator [Listeria ivanovii FSL F6-596]AIS60119.1 MarR family transcriptional regulator [Listeria ivanovii subsp. londoniensis]MBK1962408.1 MarR family transcriptional regulator [Listeria ivanovii subsp. londoniensis]MBM5721447.1 MarR family transcriptional regulator [Listeria ivanovii]SDX16525.1 DNA-binding transcriptional regulator, MarR family [Listeria ivanovii]